MRHPLLKPPGGDREIILPEKENIRKSLKGGKIWGVAHQPYFFNPGVALKFLFLDALNAGEKTFIFVDTDRLNLKIYTPLKEECRKIEVIESESPLYDYKNPGEDFFEKTFLKVEEIIENNIREDIFENYLKFKRLFLSFAHREKYLREVLAKSFLSYFGLNLNFCFLTDFLKEKSFKEFFFSIYDRAEAFRCLFNSLLDEYKKTYRFRYKNFPFPRLKDGELPFWIIRSSKREPLFEKDLERRSFDNTVIFPRASTLTLYLRLYKAANFIHGIGGANYEWIQDRIIERFYEKEPNPYFVISGTFFTGDSKERNLSYFFFNPAEIRDVLKEKMSNLMRFTPPEVR